MKKWISAFIILLCCTVMTMYMSETVTKLTYQGESAHWQSTMTFDENNKYIFNIKYIGQEDQLPLKATLNAEFLS